MPLIRPRMIGSSPPNIELMVCNPRQETYYSHQSLQHSLYQSIAYVHVFNPHASSNRNAKLSARYVMHERIKKRAYGHRERESREIEHASFAPLVLSVMDGMANEAKYFFYK